MYRRNSGDPLSAPRPSTSSGQAARHILSVFEIAASLKLLAMTAKTVLFKRSLSINPVFDLQSGYTLKLTHIIGYKHGFDCKGMSGY